MWELRAMLSTVREAKSSFTATSSAKFQSISTSWQRRTLEITWMGLINMHCNIKHFSFMTGENFPQHEKLPTVIRKPKDLMAVNC
jgi:hypothetical protein